MSAIGLLKMVHRDNERFAQLIQLKDEQPPVIKSAIAKWIYYEIPQSQWLGKDVYFSLNTFKSYRRLAKDCVRLNALYTDLDCYKIDIDVNEARYQIDEMISNEEILTPNVIIYSGKGLQLIWLMEFMSYKHYLKLWQRMQDEIYKRFRHLNSDSQAKSVTQIYRLAGSVSSKNNAIVRAECLKHVRYSITEMKEFLLPELPKYEKNDKVIAFPPQYENVDVKKESKSIMTEKSLNKTRLEDFEKLIQIQPIVNRKTLIFNYAISAKAFGMDDKLIESNLLRINNSFYEPLPNNRITGAINSVNNVEYKKKNETLIEELNITIDEQRQLKTIISKEVKRERDKARKEAKRREKGIRSMSEYQESRKHLADERLLALKVLMEQEPNLKIKDLAELLSVSAKTITRMKSQLNSET